MDLNDSMVNVIATTKFMYTSMTRAEKKVADYILDQPTEVIGLSLSEIAKRCHSGQATVVRFCKTIGVDGYSDLKLLISNQLQKENHSQTPDLEPDMSMQDIVKNIFEINILTLKNTLNINLPEEYKKACDTIVRAKSIAFFSLGDAYFPCCYANLLFKRMGLNSCADIDADMQLIDACRLKENDVAIAISHSGNSRQVVDAMKIAKENGAVTICITQKGKSLLTKYSDIIFYNITSDITIGKEIIARRVAEQTILEVLCMGVLSRIRPAATEMLKKTSNVVLVNKIVKRKSNV
jgi:DNA-binding MurR/RpiR family transcriptional regulator